MILNEKNTKQKLINTKLFFTSKMMIKLSEEEWKVLYLCDDTMGLIWLLAVELMISKEEVAIILDKLVREGLIVTDIKSKPEKISPSDKRFFYTTILGQEQLKKKGESFQRILL